jgi:1-acyl-sn-glycerol-3-phosphate acyltransferase
MMAGMTLMAFGGRLALTMLLMTLGSLLLLVVACVSAFQCPRFYREQILRRLGHVVLALWRVKLHVHGDLAPLVDGRAGAQMVYISNHSSTLDLFVLVALGLPNTRFFLSGFLRKLLPMGLLGYLTGVFWTVDQVHTQRRRQIFNRAYWALQRSGESVYLSPEGVRVTTGEIGHFNRGAFHLAAALGAPILPLYILIPQACNPGAGLNVQPCQVDVFVGRLLETSDWQIADIDSHRDSVRSFYQQWHAKMRQQKTL